MLHLLCSALMWRLCSEESHPRKYKVFVCTSAAKEYARMVWCLLDPDHQLIPEAELGSRIFAGCEGGKYLDPGAGVGTWPNNQPTPDNAPAYPGKSKVPMAFIVDDNVQARRPSPLTTLNPPPTIHPSLTKMSHIRQLGGLRAQGVYPKRLLAGQPSSIHIDQQPAAPCA